MRLRWRFSALLVTAVTAVGLTGSLALATAVESRERAHASEVMNQRVQAIDTAVTAEVGRYVETSADLAAAIGAQGDLTASDFTALTSRLNRVRLPGVSGTALVVPATDRQIARVQRSWREAGNRRLTLEPVGTSKMHLFSVLSRPLDGSAPQTGRDLSQAPEPTEALAKSFASNQVAASATYVLLKDRGLPVSQQQHSLVLATSIFAGVGTPHEGRFIGWVVMGLRGQDFLSETVRVASQDTVAVTLVDDSTPATAATPVATVSGGPVLSGTELQRRVDVQVAGRDWQLLVRPTARFKAELGPSLTLPAGGAGVVFTLLIAVVVGLLSTSRNRALAKVDSATSELRADIKRRELVEAALREREEELHVMALTDPLTGLANRRAFMDQLDQAHARATRQGSPVCVLFCDVDHFKAINDTYGHAAGDEVLREVAARLGTHFRTEDIVGRLGGDEFAVICENGSTATQILIDRLNDVLAVPYALQGELISVTVSVGMASPEDGETSTQLLERADNTMYLDKATHHLS